MLYFCTELRTTKFRGLSKMRRLVLKLEFYEKGNYTCGSVVIGLYF
jgi:hypothetical protein